VAKDTFLSATCGTQKAKAGIAEASIISKKTKSVLSVSNPFYSCPKNANIGKILYYTVFIFKKDR
jgi:hypothetical protein